MGNENGKQTTTPCNVAATSESFSASIGVLPKWIRISVKSANSGEYDKSVKHELNLKILSATWILLAL